MGAKTIRDWKSNLEEQICTCLLTVAANTSIMIKGFLMSVPPQASTNIMVALDRSLGVKYIYRDVTYHFDRHLKEYITQLSNHGFIKFKFHL